jgi:hypothetical protein
MEENKNEMQNEVSVQTQSENVQSLENQNLVEKPATNQTVTEHKDENQVTSNQKKSNSKILIIVVIVAVVAIGIVLFLAFGGNKKPTPGTTDNPSQKSEITKTVHKIEGNKYLVEIKNNKSSIIDLDVTMYIYGEKKEILNSIQKKIKSLGIGQSTYIELDYNGYEENEYEVVIENEKNSNSSNVFTKQLELNHKKQENDIEFTLKNNSTSKVNIIDFEVIYYQNNKIVKYNTFGYDTLEASQMIGDTIYTPQDENGDTINYDKYDITFRAYN